MKDYPRLSETTEYLRARQRDADELDALADQLAPVEHWGATARSVLDGLWFGNRDRCQAVGSPGCSHGWDAPEAELAECGCSCHVPPAETPESSS